MSGIDITGLDKAAVLAALYNAARPRGMGFMDYTPKPMTTEEAKLELDRSFRSYFDYLNGRVMKVDLSGDSFDSRLFNRDNGEGAAEMAIQSLRSSGDPDNSTIRAIHVYGRTNAAHELQEQLEEQRKRREGTSR